MSCIFASSYHGVTNHLGDAVVRCVGVETAHEFAFGIHQVEIGAVVDEVVLTVRPALVRYVVDPILLGNCSDLLRRARESDDSRIK
jgi:hypothetical protein